MDELKFFGICILFGFALFLGVGCGGTYQGPQSRPPVDNIHFDAHMSDEMYNTIKNDIYSLDSMKIDRVEPSVLQAMGLHSSTTGSISGRDYKKWLEAGLNFIVDQTFTTEGRVSNLQLNYPFQNPRLFPVIQPGMSIDENEAITGGGVLANNLGSVLYFHGKLVGTLLQVEIEGYGAVPVPSPMAGVFQIGPAFNKLHSAYAGVDSYQLAEMYYQVIVLGHERMHNLGQGEDLGLFHKPCPYGHTYAGLAVCDYCTNTSPYLFGGDSLEGFMNSNSAISIQTQQALKLLIADSRGRSVRFFQNTSIPQGFSTFGNAPSSLGHACNLAPEGITAL